MAVSTNKNAPQDAPRMEIMTNTQFTMMLHDNRFLVVKKSENGNPHVVAECFLEQVAAQICQLLTDSAETELTLENAPKQK
jgi:hypothetical protein